MKTFIEYLEAQNVTEAELNALNESLQSEWTDELEERVDAAVDAFLAEYKNEDGTYDIDRFNVELTNEGILGSILGGLTGFALGKSVGKLVAKTLGIEKGLMYDLLTSRLVGAALGASLGKNMF
jgi:hypothetical protein